MNFRKRSSADTPQFQITPMIDVVFLLLCFFITVSVFSQWEYEVDIVLPTAQSAKIPERLPGEVIVNIDRQGAVTINQNNLTLDDLQNRLKRLATLFPGQPIVIRADRATAYEHLMEVVDACRLADIWNISFATGEIED
ncbi:MAG: biopolymer transporter ExbD [Lentisphaerae bacterium]|jgi:biopolymer transport protein ExbD|nr:biopolymer transporter ExbD [Lentisphaerota bacterium]